MTFAPLHCQTELSDGADRELTWLTITETLNFCIFKLNAYMVDRADMGHGPWGERADSHAYSQPLRPYVRVATTKD
jgi:hypothetical protein